MSSLFGLNAMEFDTVVDVLARLGIAIVLGGLLGLERQMHGQWAGLRTHMLVAMGAAMFVMAGQEAAGQSSSELTRVVQGIAAGIGFLGAGTILKLSDQRQVKGLTTASSIWLAAAVGTAAGIGMVILALGGTFVSLIVLAALRPLEKWLDRFET